ncbi:MAG TPA: carboxymuconolactone decarboxylase family protein [Micromonosporaceae bacterium]|nr:carboxymuconolactone decarboxylase family protein [Micromonosporaceae bacterium]
MEARMKHPAIVLTEAMPALMNLSKAVEQAGLPKVTVDLVALRASQINGCSVCVGMHATDLREQGQSDERLFSVAAWRETEYFTDAERAALALTEATTRLADTGDAVSDDIWNEAADHYTETELAGLVMAIAMINLWNRLNAATRQLAGGW